MSRAGKPKTTLRAQISFVTVCTILGALVVADHIVVNRNEAAIERVGAVILLGLAAGMVLGFIYLFNVASRMSKRIDALAEKFRYVAAGDYSTRAEAQGGDEVSELGSAFNAMVESLARSHDILTEKANTDALTGLYNHRFFQERLTVEFSRAARYGSKLALLMIDLDHFKLFNDMNGHPAGDQALREIGTIISEQVRDVDVAARYGGEEFAVILPETSFTEAQILADRLRRTVEHQIFGDSGRMSCRLTLSVGVAEYPAHSSDRSSLLRAADSALYLAKMQGRNSVVVFNGECGEDPKPDPHKLYVLLHATDLSTVEALAAAIDAKHGHPQGHSVRVARLAAQVGERMEMDEEERSSLYVASLLRDIGQIAIPDWVLEKHEALSAGEMEMIEKHPALGHAIVQKSPYMSAMLPTILHHHERYDGKGYPEGLSADAIPLPARIVAAADAYESMLVPRPYRDAMTPEEAEIEMRRYVGLQFDPEVVSALLEAVRERIEKAA